MSLNWQFTDKEGFAKIKGDPMNDAFIWGCMFIDMGEITEKNAREWMDRYALIDSVDGPFYYRGADHQEVWRPTLEETRARIGLKTNVTTRSLSAFLMKVWKAHTSNRTRHITKTTVAA